MIKAWGVNPTAWIAKRNFIPPHFFSSWSAKTNVWKGRGGEGNPRRCCLHRNEGREGEREKGVVATDVLGKEEEESWLAYESDGRWRRNLSLSAQINLVIGGPKSPSCDYTWRKEDEEKSIADVELPIFACGINFIKLGRGKNLHIGSSRWKTLGGKRRICSKNRNGRFFSRFFSFCFMNKLLQFSLLFFRRGEQIALNLILFFPPPFYT